MQLKKRKSKHECGKSSTNPASLAEVLATGKPDTNIIYTSTIEATPQLSKFLTGALRASKVGKSRPDLIPGCIMLRDGRHMANGVLTHGDRNWEKGIPDSVYLASLMRHVNEWADGDRTVNSKEDHLAAARFNLMGLMFNEIMIARGILPVNLHDLQLYRKPTHADPIPNETAYTRSTTQPGVCRREVPHTYSRRRTRGKNRR